MADNVPITPGAGANIATDDVGGVQFQKMKIDMGGDGVSVPLVGDVTYGIPVDVKRGTLIAAAGDVASGATDSGNPVKFGGVFRSVLPTVTDGQRVDAQFDNRGRLIVSSSPVGDKSAFTIGTDNVQAFAGLYQSSVDTLATGQIAVPALDSHRNMNVNMATTLKGEDQTNDLIGMLTKPVVASTYAPTLYTDLASLVTKANIKGFPGNVLSFDVTNVNAAVRYFQLHNKATAPAGTNVPIYSLAIPAGTATNPGRLTLGRDFFTAAGTYFSTGVGFAVSTTLATFTDSATASEHNVAVHYI